MNEDNTIDIRGYKEKGDDLKELIENLVADTQRYVVRTLPDKLLMTGKQYDMLQTDPMMRGFWTTQERVYVTKYNAMDVVIKDA